MSIRKYYNGDEISIKSGMGVKLDITLPDGTILEDVEPRRMFPVSNAKTYISFISSKGDEYFILKDVSRLDSISLGNLEVALDRYYMIPNICEIKDVEEKFGLIQWKVMTDRGEFEFDIHNRHSDIKLVSKGRILVRDSNDNRYEIHDYRKLTKRSQAFIAGDL